jgi:hypothetical protein
LKVKGKKPSGEIQGVLLRAVVQNWSCVYSETRNSELRAEKAYCSEM